MVIVITIAILFMAMFMAFNKLKIAMTLAISILAISILAILMT